MVAEPQLLHTCAPMARTTFQSAALNHNPSIPAPNTYPSPTLNQNPQILHTYHSPKPYTSYPPYQPSMHFQDPEVHHPSYRQPWNRDPSYCQAWNQDPNQVQSWNQHLRQNQPGIQPFQRDGVNNSSTPLSFNHAPDFANQHSNHSFQQIHVHNSPVMNNHTSMPDTYFHLENNQPCQNPYTTHSLQNNPYLNPKFQHQFPQTNHFTHQDFNQPPVNSPLPHNAYQNMNQFHTALPMSHQIHNTQHFPTPLDTHHITPSQPESRIEEYEEKRNNRFHVIKRVLGIPLQHEASSPYLSGSGSESSLWC